MRKLKGLVLALALLFGATLAYQAAAIAAETSTATDQKIEKNTDKKHTKKKLGVKKRKSKASPAPAATASPADSSNKS